MPEISIAMGVYNCSGNKEELKKSIDSILNQTFTDFEFIICDDGSSDDTYEFLCRIKEADSRIIVIRNDQNRGLAYALNHCISESKGRYIARQDADDYSVLTRLEKQYAFLENNPQFGLVSSNIFLYNGENLSKEVVKIEYPGIKDLMIATPLVHSATMFRKESLDKVNCYRAVRVTRRCEDYDLFMRMYAIGIKGYNIQEPLVCVKFSEQDYLRRRKYIYYLEETLVRVYGFWKMKRLFSPKGLFLVLRPAVIGLVPTRLMYRIRRNSIKGL